MTGALHHYLSSDHDRLDDLLERATAKPGVIDMECYGEFRKRLLRHISIEEKIVLPAIARWQGGQKAAVADRLHLDHGAIVSLMVPPPTPSIILTLKGLFAVHNPLEENDGGLYDVFETLAEAGAETETMLEQLNAAPAVPVLPHNPKPELLDLAKQALARAGHEFKEREFDQEFLTGFCTRIASRTYRQTETRRPGIRYLLDHGARPDLKDASGRTPADVATGAGVKPLSRGAGTANISDPSAPGELSGRAEEVVGRPSCTQLHVKFIAMETFLRFTGAVERDPAIDVWIKQQAGDLVFIAREWFDAMRESGDDVRELMHDGCPVACVEDAPFGYVNAFTSHVNVGFFHGADLPDPVGSSRVDLQACKLEYSIVSPK